MKLFVDKSLNFDPTTGSHPDTAPPQQALSDKHVISKNSISRTDWLPMTFGSVQTKSTLDGMNTSGQ
jgi:hypothetical protein